MQAVRPATRADTRETSRLCQLALSEVRSQRGGELYTRRETGLVAKALLRPGGLDRLISDRRRRIVIATSDDVPVGFAVGHTEDAGEAAIGVVDALYVENPSRRKGLGSAMLQDLSSWMTGRGCKAVDALALPGNRAMKSLFESAGFKARLITMNRQDPKDGLVES